MKVFVLSEHGLGTAYELLSGLIVPRPIALVSTQDAEGRANLAPFSYFMVGGINPPSVAFCPVRGREGDKKETLRNIEATRQYVINLVTPDMADGMNATGGDYPGDADKWAMSGFSPVPSMQVAPARVAQSPVQLECELMAVVPHGDGPGSADYVIGEVKVAHIREDLVNENGTFGPVDLLSRLGQRDYLAMGAGTFAMNRPDISQFLSRDAD
jgi:flavin reductase (DIM6/NTAB) family NADH-FMN oxidoreductase RutF